MPKKNSIYGDSANMPGGSTGGLGSKARPVSSRPQGRISAADEAKGRIKYPDSRNYRPSITGSKPPRSKPSAATGGPLARAKATVKNPTSPNNAVGRTLRKTGVTKGKKK